MRAKVFLCRKDNAFWVPVVKGQPEIRTSLVRPAFGCQLELHRSGAAFAEDGGAAGAYNQAQPLNDHR